MKKPPATNKDQLLKYNTSQEQCFCPDFVQRGGSYVCPEFGDQTCKHVIFARQLAAEVAANRKTVQTAPIRKAPAAISAIQHNPFQTLLSFVGRFQYMELV